MNLNIKTMKTPLDLTVGDLFKKYKKTDIEVCWISLYEIYHFELDLNSCFKKIVNKTLLKDSTIVFTFEDTSNFCEYGNNKLFKIKTGLYRTFWYEHKDSVGTLFKISNDLIRLDKLKKI